MRSEKEKKGLNFYRSCQSKDGFIHFVLNKDRIVFEYRVTKFFRLSKGRISLKEWPLAS